MSPLRHWHRRLVLTAALLPFAATTAAAQKARRATPAELHALGQRIVDAEIAQYGEAQNPQWQADVQTILGRLTRAASVSDSNLRFVIVNDAEFNAAAVPGGFLIVNAGLLDGTTQLAARERAIDSARRDRFLAYTAAVLGHELAHQTLGHTANIERMLPSRSADESFEHRLERAMENPSLLRRQAKSRAQELAADRTGALYMLRAGFEIQTAMDLFRALDSLESGDRASAVDSVRTLTWLSDHPRGSQREGALEAFRGTLKLDQGRYDDALILVRTNVQLDTAVTLLDSVLAHFPELHEARHLRAAALHRMYLRHVRAERQAIRSAVPTYTARFITAIRGESGLERARLAYADLLRQELVPYALSNLGVLDAYAGRLPLALARADSAVLLDTASAEVRVNQGAVLYLAGHYREALAAFQAAARRAPADVPALRFDIARTVLAMGDTARGRDLLARYAASDAESEWGDLARRLARVDSAGVARPAGTASFAVSAGAALDERASDVRQAMGEPERKDVSEGRAVWQYESRGLRVAFSSQMRVAMLGIGKQDAGSIDGVRVGDPASRAQQAWGAPDEEESGVRYYERHGVVVAMVEERGVIFSLAAALLR